MRFPSESTSAYRGDQAFVFSSTLRVVYVRTDTYTRMAIGFCGRKGLVIARRDMLDRLGGTASALAAILRKFTVVERDRHSASRGKSSTLPWKRPTVRRAYQVSADGETIAFPLSRAARFRASGFLSSVRAGTGDNSPLPIYPPTGDPPAMIPGKLFDFQMSIVDVVGYYMKEMFSERFGRVYLQLGTGLGKTRVGIAVAVALGVPTVVVVPTLAIQDQWVEECGTCSTIRCQRYCNTKKRPPNGADRPTMIVGVINTMRKKDPAFFEGYGLTILDEAHEYHSEKSQQILWAAQTKYVLGLSATPLERPDGMDRLIPLFLGDVVLESDIPDIAGQLLRASFAGSVEAVRYRSASTDLDVVRSTGLDVMSTIGRILADGRRTEVVADQVARLCSLGHNVFVFAEFRDYLTVLLEAIKRRLAPVPDDSQEISRTQEENVKGYSSYEPPKNRAGSPEVLVECDEDDGPEDIPILKGGVSASEVHRARNCRVVLTTYGFSRRGISLQNMTAMVLASPRRNGMRQILGRILRQGSRDVARRVIDVVDVNSRLKNQFADRKKVYAEKGWPISKIEAK